ncbi:MAG: hypothetical protein A2787_00780 [Omnitrophica WOR_2 bacterium RIFCSPHIGHO2_01_FULL_48_9]|nr:MAG: hypothetical protein A3D10_07050 [Omnitrophica WOR_2 bacterium RIFCSPHIGHO2_02_FULL_48_11]OGX30710.1 MAG: hypothetical protein A2787_00780 [Omnitrophica WOR_2 bacterium RIFCSPHIGHO2_01_FULL_48_9]
MKKISDSERILIGWGKDGKRICYFLSHKILEGPIPCNPEDLQSKINKLVDTIDRRNHKKNK